MFNPLIYSIWIKDVKMALIDAMKKLQRCILFRGEIMKESKELNFIVLFYIKNYLFGTCIVYTNCQVYTLGELSNHLSFL